MRMRTVLIFQTFAVLACVAQVQTIEPPATAALLPTSLPTLISLSATVPANTATPVLEQPTSTATLATAPSVVKATATLQILMTDSHNPYAVILVSQGDVLNIRTGPGVTNALAGRLEPTAKDAQRTGRASAADSDSWVEIHSAGGDGWVNSRFLTEQVPSSTFCTDARVNTLLNSLKTAMLSSNGELLSSLVGPVHGVDVRLWRYGTIANYTPAEAAWLFQSDYVVDWGPAPGSGQETPGTFKAQLLPKMQEVLSANFTLHCNNTLDFATFSTDPWPPEYSNINYYTVYKPGSEQYGGLDWRAWTVGIEYVAGEPTIFSLIHYQWEP